MRRGGVVAAWLSVGTVMRRQPFLNMSWDSCFLLGCMLIKLILMFDNYFLIHFKLIHFKLLIILTANTIDNIYYDVYTIAAVGIFRYKHIVVPEY